MEYRICKIFLLIMNKNKISNQNFSFFVYFIIALALFISHFFYFTKFGFYEDDYSLITLGWEESFSHTFSYPIFSGRLLGNFFPYFFSILSSSIGGISILYVFSYLIILSNSLLFYLLIRRQFGYTLGFLIALFYLFYPADTTKILLIHAFQLQISLLFFLLASALYFSKYKCYSYIVIALTLITYETLFLPFFVVPLLKYQWNKKLFQKLLSHIIILFSLLIITLYSRYLLAEDRANELLTSDKSELFFHFIESYILGFLASLSTFIIRPITALMLINYKSIIVFILIFILILPFINSIKPSNSKAKKNIIIKWITFQFKGCLIADKEFIICCKLLLTGFLAILLASILRSEFIIK